AKMSFGGLGKNIFNPALVARVFLLISFPVQMTSWPVPKPITEGLADVVTGPTPLAIVKEGLDAGKTMSELHSELPEYYNYLIGQMGGSLGEVSAIALILGGLYMIWRKIITWEIPVSILGFGIGLLTILIRIWGAYPEGVSFAILLMNAAVPLINMGFKPRRFGIKPGVELTN
ncbi:MAG: RnfABCDGE type electron transport complex subunit D, partial [bacterium]